MVNMSRDYAKKLKAIRNAEKLTQAQFSQVTGVSVGTIGNYESGYKPARIEVVEKVIQVERFEKYTMWILHDKTFPAAGQVARLSLLMAPFSRRAIRFQSALPKNHPDLVAMLANAVHRAGFIP